MKKLISVLFAVLLLAALCGIASAETGIGVEPGQQMPDFTVSLTDGSTATLSELLKEKDLVVLNIFASFCKPCEHEFPDMEKVYQANKDRMELISVSGYDPDTMDVIAAYKESHGLSFPMGLTGEGLSFLTASNFPTTIMIDRNGMVGLVKVGAFLEEGEFEGKVNNFLSADYNGQALPFEKAVGLSQYIFYILVSVTFCALVLVVGRWGMLRKAGKQSWRSLIPFLNAYEEYSLCWNGWLGVAADLCLVAYFVTGFAGVPGVIRYAALAVSLVISVLEGFKLAKAFGRGKGAGVLFDIPVVRSFARMILGVSKARYQPIKAA